MILNFTDNQNIRAEDLNKVATDLNVTFSAFQNGQPYAVTKLNEITKAILTPGVLSTGSACSVAGGKVNPGIIVFNSGAKAEITSPEAYEAQQGAFYVFAEYTAASNSAKIKTASTLPTGDVVPLAYITDAGQIQDRRKIAAAKVGTPTRSTMLDLTTKFRYKSDEEIDNGTIDLGFTPTLALYKPKGNFVDFSTDNSKKLNFEECGVTIQINGTIASFKTYSDGKHGYLTREKVITFI